MKALLVIDLQNGIVEQKDFNNELNKISMLINYFESNNMPVIFTRHLDDDIESCLYKDSEGSKILDKFYLKANYVVDKKTPNSFFNTNLEDILNKEKVKDLVICGFNTEYCCLFTSIVASDKNFNVYFIEDATGTICDESTYEMPGLDIKDFVGSILNWSNVVKVLYFDEFTEEIANGFIG